MPLETGMYEPSNKKHVVVWRSPDADGDGPEVWEDRTVGGQVVGRDRKKDNNGRVIKRYKAPQGFTNFPSFDGTENYVMTAEDGSPFRMPNGETVGIKEGSAVVIHANGKVETIDDEYGMYLFEEAHERVGDEEDTPAEKLAREQQGNEDRNKEIEALEARLKELRPEQQQTSQTAEQEQTDTRNESEKKGTDTPDVGKSDPEAEKAEAKPGARRPAPPTVARGNR